MSVSVEEPTGAAGGRDDSSSGEDVLAGHTKELHDPTASKAVRVLTVLAYLLSVSFAAILLSVYYVFVWDPPRNHLAERARNASNVGASMLQAYVSSQEPGDSPIGESVAARSESQPQLPAPPDSFTAAAAASTTAASAASDAHTEPQPTSTAPEIERDANETTEISLTSDTAQETTS